MTWRFSIHDLDIALESRGIWRSEMMIIRGIPVDVSPATDWFSGFRVWVAPIELSPGKIAALEIVAQNAGYCRTLYQATLDGEFVASNRPWSLPLPDWAKRSETEEAGFVSFFGSYALAFSLLALVVCLLSGGLMLVRSVWDPTEFLRQSLVVEVISLGFALLWSTVRWRTFVSLNQVRRTKLRAHLAAA